MYQFLLSWLLLPYPGSNDRNVAQGINSLFFDFIYILILQKSQCHSGKKMCLFEAKPLSKFPQLVTSPVIIITGAWLCPALLHLAFEGSNG